MISNPNNAQIRAIRKLRKRRERQRRGAMLVEGHRPIAIAIRTGRPVLELIHTPDAKTKRSEVWRAIKGSGAKVLEVSPEVMASVASVGSAPDVICVVPVHEATLDEAAGAFGLGAVLAGVRDPASAGSILASCAAAGGSVAIGTAGTTDLFAPKPVRCAAGAHFLLRVAGGVDPAACAASLRAAGVRVLAVAPDGGEMPSTGWTEPIAVLVGEDGAVPEALSRIADARIRIARPGAELRPPLAAEAAVVLFGAAWRLGNGKG